MALALLLLLVPLLPRPTGTGNARYSLPILLLLGLPLATAGLYRLVGAPEAMATHVYAARPPQAEAVAPPAAAAGQAQAASTADDTQEQALERWMQQAKRDEHNDRPADAREAYAQALRIAPDISAAIVGWVAADMATHSDFAIDAASRARLQHVIAREPDNQRGLWLLGISDFSAARLRRGHRTLAPSAWLAGDRLANAESGGRQDLGGRIDVQCAAVRAWRAVTQAAPARLGLM